MNHSSDGHPKGPISGDDVLKHASDDAAGISEEVDVEIVDRPGKQPSALRRGSEIKRVRGHETRRRLIEMHAFGGKRLIECARELGLSYGRVNAVWRSVVAEAHGARGTKEEHVMSVRCYLDCHYRKVMEGAQALLGDAAAYGAVIVQAGKALADLHGLKTEDVLPAGLSLEDVGREVRVVSPLLIDRLDKVRALAGVGVQSQSGTPALSVGGIPVEGAAHAPVAASGVKSPLLEGSVAERMLRGMEREGERVVERVQLEGADAALDAMPRKRR